MNTSLSIPHETPQLNPAVMRLPKNKPSFNNRASLTWTSDTAQEIIPIEKSILQRIADGDKAAVKDCLDSYRGLVWSQARRFLRNPADAEDAVQDIFIAIWSAAGKYDPAIASESTFIVLIARRRLIDQLRKTARRPATESLDVEESAPAQPFVNSTLEESAEIENVRHALESIQPECREILTMSHYEGYSHSEIASRLEVPLGTVKSRMRRGLVQVREQLQLTA
jgi:RNA polymerase sigma factor (sigma-70 family)